MHKRLSKQELKALQKEMLLNILSAGKIIFTHYKNKQLKQRGKYETTEIREMVTNG